MTNTAIALFLLSLIRSVASISPRAATATISLNDSTSGSHTVAPTATFPTWGYAVIAIAGVLVVGGGGWLILRPYLADGSGRSAAQLARERTELLSERARIQREKARVDALLGEFNRQNADITRGLDHAGEPRYIPTAATPHEYICPITQQIMRQPVEVEPGRSYEYLAIKRWYDLGHRQTPVTRQALTNPDVVGVNAELRTRIAEHILSLTRAHAAADEDSGDSFNLRR